MLKICYVNAEKMLVKGNCYHHLKQFPAVCASKVA